MMMLRSHHVVLVGLMGSGKTTVGELVAGLLGWAFSDSDEWIEGVAGVTGAEVARRDGVDELHRLEARHLLEALASEVPTVIAAAASVVDDPVCREALAGAYVVWLDPPVEALAERAAVGDHRRDLADAGDTFAGLHARRVAAYRQTATLHIKTTPDPPTIAALVASVIRTT